MGICVSNVHGIGSPDPPLLSMGANSFSLSSFSWASSSPHTCLPNLKVIALILRGLTIVCAGS